MKTYDESLNFLRASLDSARVGDKDKLDGFRRLERFVRAVETRMKPEGNFDALIAHENAISPSLMADRCLTINHAGAAIQGNLRYFEAPQ